MRRFELHEEASGKFWEIDLDGASFRVRFGKLGAPGQTQTKTFDTAAAAEKAAAALVREKTKKGYVERDADAAAKPTGGKKPAGGASAGTSQEPIESLFRRLLDLCAMADPNLELAAGATDAQLAKLEAALGFALPADLAAILRVSNGVTSSELHAEGFLSLDELLEQWRFHYEPTPPMEPSTEDRRLVPICNDSSVITYLVATPGAKHEGALALWDNDGDSWGDTSERVAPSLRAHLEKQEAKARKSLPKGVPLIEGFAFGAEPSPAQVDALVTALAAKKGAIHNELGSLTRNRAVGRAVLEGLLRLPKVDLFAHEDNHAQLAALADVIDVELLLAGLDRYTKVKSKTSDGRFLEGWIGATYDIVAHLVARDPAKVAAHRFGGLARDGHALTARRLGVGPALSNELKLRVVRECYVPPSELLEIGGAPPKRTEANGDPFDFALAPLFDSIGEYRRLLIDFILAPDSAELIFPRALIGQALQAASAEEAAVVLTRGSVTSVYDVLAYHTPAESRSKTLVDAVALLPDTVDGYLNVKKAIAILAAYVAASREQRPFPELDDWLRHVNLMPGFYESSFATDFTWAPVLAALGPERVKKAFARYPLVAGT